MKLIVIIAFAILSMTVNGQKSTDSSGINSFNRGLEFYDADNLDSALFLWTRIVDEQIGVENDTYSKAFFNIPALYWQKKSYQKAKEWYQKILVSNLRDDDETGSLMEPHTNYKHKSAMALAGLFQLDSNYTEVLNWLNQADTLYRYWGFEGSATNVSKRQAYLLEWKTDVLLKLNQTDSAIKSILTELICSRNLEGFFEASEETLISLVDKNKFVEDLDSSISSLGIKKISDSRWIASFQLHSIKYEIPISNVYPNRNVPHYWRIYFIEKNSEPDKQKLLDYLRQRSFYKRLKK